MLTCGPRWLAVRPATRRCEPPVAAGRVAGPRGLCVAASRRAGRVWAARERGTGRFAARAPRRAASPPAPRRAPRQPPDTARPPPPPAAGRGRPPQPPGQPPAAQHSCAASPPSCRRFAATPPARTPRPTRPSAGPASALRAASHFPHAAPDAFPACALVRSRAAIPLLARRPPPRRRRLGACRPHATHSALRAPRPAGRQRQRGTSHPLARADCAPPCALQTPAAAGGGDTPFAALLAAHPMSAVRARWTRCGSLGAAMRISVRRATAGMQLQTRG
jgi:hypothetical protein